MPTGVWERNKPKIILICKQCDKKFEVLPCSKNRKYCSRECWMISNKGKKRKPYGHKLPVEYMNRNWLYKRYIDKRLSVREIAELCGLSIGTIYYWLKIFNIKCLSQEGERNNFYGRHHTKETKQIISKSGEGRIGYWEGKHRDEDTKEKMSKGMIESWKDPDSGLNSKEFRQKLSDNTFKRKGTWLSHSHNNNKYYYGGFREDIGHFVRSRWEANVSRYLKFLIKKEEIKKYEYEVDTFEFKGIKRGNRSYTPDFKVHLNNNEIEYWEVKGWMDKESKTKLRRFQKYYPKEFKKFKIIIYDPFAKDKENGEVMKFLLDDLKMNINDIISYKQISERLGGLILNWE